MHYETILIRSGDKVRRVRKLCWGRRLYTMDESFSNSRTAYRREDIINEARGLMKKSGRFATMSGSRTAK